MRHGPNPRRTRRGSVYLLVLAAGAALTFLTIAGLALTRSERVSRSLASDAGACVDGAWSGQELAMAALNADAQGSAWRVGASATVADATLAGVAVKVVATDPADGDLADSVIEPVKLTATATRGAARQVLAVTLNPVTANLPCMAAAAWASGTLAFSAATVYSDGVVGANGAVTATGSSVNATVGGFTVTGTTYNGSVRTGVPTQAVPGREAVDLWAARATAISYSSLTGGLLTKVVLSPSVNPYGAPNAAGVYLIDCGGANITISACRVNGTLIIRRPGASSRLSGAVFLEGRTGQPVLLVDGDMQFAQLAADLTEAGNTTNFNPAGAPFRGIADGDQADSYPSTIEGLAFVYGNATVNSSASMTIQGTLLVRGSLTVQGTLRAVTRTPETPIEGFLTVTGFTMDSAGVARLVD